MLDFHTLLTMTSCIKNLLPELALIMASTWFMVLNQLLFCKQYNLIQFVSTSTYRSVTEQIYTGYSQHFSVMLHQLLSELPYYSVTVRC